MESAEEDSLHDQSSEDEASELSDGQVGFMLASKVLISWAAPQTQECIVLFASEWYSDWCWSICF